MKNHSKKRALFSSIISLILCVTMLLGTTFAWFTSSVTNTGNRIRTGELGVALYKYNAEAGEYKDISDGTGDIFTDSGENGTLWEPGRTQIVFLEVRNAKSLALNYNLILDVKADTSNGAKLEDVLSYAILPGVTGDTFDKNQFMEWDDILRAGVDVETGTVPAGETTAAPNGALEAGESDFFALAVHMDEEAGNEYQDCGITIDVSVMARQMASEYDSFGNQYDADSLFTQQADTPVVLTDILNGTGDMETANQAKWKYSSRKNYHGLYQFVEGNDAGSLNGTGYLKMTSTDGCQYGSSCTGNDTHKAANQLISVEYNGFSSLDGIAAGKLYELKAWIKQDDNTKPMKFQITQDPGEAQVYEVCANEAGKWEEVTFQFRTASDAKKSKFRFVIYSELNVPDDNDIGESVCIDDIRICSVEGMSEAEISKQEFKAMLAKEAEESMLPVVDDGVPTEWREKVDGTPDNYLLNGSFDTGNDNWEPNGWSVNWYEWINDTDGQYLKIENNETHRAPAIGQRVEVVPEAEYQIAFKYKIDPSNTATSPTVEFECFTNATDPGDDGHLEGVDLIFNYADFVRDGNWHEASYRVRVPLRTEWIQVFIRHTNNATLENNPTLGKTDDDIPGAVYYDDVTLTMTSVANVLAVDSEMIFYYRDMGEVNFEAILNQMFTDQYGTGDVVFEVYDGQNAIYTSEAMPLDNSSATLKFDLNKIQKLNTPYCVKATLYVDGVEKGVAGKNIYVVERPTALDKNGKYVKFGEDFFPVMGYHVYNNAKPKLHEAGINVVQFSGDDAKDAETLLERLDELEVLGVKGMVCLYFGGLPAAHESNIAKTIAIVSDERVRNHPAMFGYNISDEPYLHQDDPRQDLENSYRLIREYDKDNVIMFVENLESVLGSSSLYADMMIMDPYHEAAGAGVYKDFKSATKNLAKEKQVMTLLRTFPSDEGFFPTPDDLRNNNYQALIAGAAGIGYFSVSDVGNFYVEELTKLNSEWANHVRDKKQGYIPLWEFTMPGNNTAGLDLWNTMGSFSENEYDIAGNHFINDKGTKLIEDINIAAGYMYYSWATEAGKVYLVVLDVKGGDVTVDIPLKAANGSDMGSYTAKFIAGRAGATDITGSGSLNITLTGVEALLFEITAN